MVDIVQYVTEALEILTCHCKKSDDLEDTIEINNIFTRKIYKEISTKTENICVSPFSIAIALSLIQSGADGAAVDEIIDTMLLPEDVDEIEYKYRSLIAYLGCKQNCRLLLANKIYIRREFSFDEDYEHVAQEVYLSTVEKTDFVPEESVAELMNKWVEERTEGTVKNLVQPGDLSDETKMIVVSTLCIQAFWNYQFKVDDEKFNFYTNGDEVVEVQTMTCYEVYNYCSSLDLSAKFLELFFEHGDGSMIIVLPEDIDGLNSINEQNVLKYLARPNFTYEHVKVVLPKFKFETSINFVDILKNIGIETLFEENFDLTDVCVDKMLQKVVIEVNEVGVGDLPLKCDDDEPLCGLDDDSKTFIVDRPFMCYITVGDVFLFVGKVVNPVWS